MNFLHKIPLRIFNLFYPLKIIGKENIPEGKAILCSNHFSLLDCGFVATAYSKDIKFLAKKEIFKNKTGIFIGVLLKISSDKFWTENTITNINQDENNIEG